MPNRFFPLVVVFCVLPTILGCNRLLSCCRRSGRYESLQRAERNISPERLQMTKVDESKQNEVKSIREVKVEEDVLSLSTTIFDASLSESHFGSSASASSNTSEVSAASSQNTTASTNENNQQLSLVEDFEAISLADFLRACRYIWNSEIRAISSILTENPETINLSIDEMVASINNLSFHPQINNENNVGEDEQKEETQIPSPPLQTYRRLPLQPQIIDKVTDAPDPFY